MTEASLFPNLEYRKLPAVDALLRHPAVQALVESYGSAAVTAAIRQRLDEARAQIRAGEPAPDDAVWRERIEAQLADALRPTLRPVINATGVIIHTDLGRAPLSAAARAAVDQISAGYNNLEYDLAAGERGSRYSHTRGLLCDLSGAEDALVVNNNASAIYLVLAALCAGREVIVSRGQLVEIGGGFRIPDVLRQSGARLVEVGTTNRTHPRDFANAIGPETAALMRIHASNFRQIGFVTMPELAELVTIARATPGKPLVIDDLGSGTLLDTAPFGLMPEPTVPESVAAGADVITFSGDKLLGGPQAGIIVGRAEAIAQLRRHPLARALARGQNDAGCVGCHAARLRHWARLARNPCLADDRRHTCTAPGPRRTLANGIGCGGPCQPTYRRRKHRGWGQFARRNVAYAPAGPCSAPPRPHGRAVAHWQSAHCLHHSTRPAAL